MEKVITEIVAAFTTYVNPSAVIACWLLGWAIKEYKWYSTKHIPLTMMVVGVVVTYFSKGSFSFDTFMQGIVSGAVSVLFYDTLMGYLKAYDKENTLSDEWKGEK